MSNFRYRILADQIYTIDFGNDQKVEIPGQEILDLIWLNNRAQFMFKKIDTNPITVQNPKTV